MGDPTIFTLEQAKLFPSNAKTCHFPCNFPGRLRSHSPNYVLGGMHLSAYRFLPQVLLKLVTMSESNTVEYGFFKKICEMIEKNSDVHKVQLKVASGRFDIELGGDVGI